MPTKKSFFSDFACLLLSEGIFTSVFKRYKVIRNSLISEITKQQKSRILYSFFASLWKDPDPQPDTYKIITDPDPGGAKTYGSGTLVFTFKLTFLKEFSDGDCKLDLP